MSNEYELQKWVWDDNDFERMGWHDATIHGIAFGPAEFELSLDIDYVFEWVHPLPDQEFFRFWVAPCTLIFANVHEVRFEAESYGESWLSVGDLHRVDPRTPRNAAYIGKHQEWLWTFECHHAELTFRSVGFRQYVRKAPVNVQSQVLGRRNVVVTRLIAREAFNKLRILNKRCSQPLRSGPPLKRPYLRKEYCIRVLDNPIRSEPQEMNRYRFWAAIPELENRYLRVVTLDDKVTIHNAFPDRGFKP